MTPNVYFTADLHIGHKFVAEKRGFQSVDEHDDCIIEAWRSRVKSGDRIYVCGDFNFRKENILHKLPGDKHLIRGNHDRKIHDGWSSVADIRNVKIKDDNAPRGKQYIVLCHFPMLSWNKMHYGSWMLHGHCHGNLLDSDCKRLDVGVDTRDDWSPWSYDEVLDAMLERDIKVVDHHEPKL